MTEHSMLFAIHKLGVSDPDDDLDATGHWNADGSPIMKKAVKSIPAGSLFPSSLIEGGDAEIQRLLKMGAVRHPDDVETAIFERDQVEG